MKINIVIITFLIFFLVPSMNVYSSDNEIHRISPIWTSRSHVRAVAITSDNRYVVTASGANLLFWDLSAIKIAKRFKGHVKDIYQITLSADNKYAFTGDEAGVLKIWDIIADTEIRSINAHATPIITINQSSDGRYIMTGSHDGIKKIWDFQTGKELQHFKGKEFTLSALSADGKQVIGEDNVGYIVFWDATTGEVINRIKKPDKQYCISLFSPDNRYAIVERVKNTAFYPELWDLIECKKIRIFNFNKYNKNYQSFISPFGGAFSYDNKRVLSMFIDFTRFVLWNIYKDQPVLVFADELYEKIGPSVFSRDGKYIVSGCEDDMTRLWDAVTGKEIVSMVSLKDDEWLIVTPDGYYDASEKADVHMIVEDKNDNKCALSNYRETFYRPDLLKFVLSGGSLKEYKKISDVPIPEKCRIGN